MPNQGVWPKLATQVVSKLRVSLEDESGQGHSAFRFGYWKLVPEPSVLPGVLCQLMGLLCFAE